MSTVYTRSVHGQLTHTEMDATINNLNSDKYEYGNNPYFNYMHIGTDIVHKNDTNTWMRFTTDSVTFRTGGSDRLYINNTNIYANREIRCPYNITAYYSDERLKTKVGDIENAVDKVKTLDAFYYVENDLAKSFGYESNNKQVALSAQEVQKVLPEAVTLAPFDTGDNEETGETYSKTGEDYLTVDYARMVPLLVQAIKEQQEQIEELKVELSELRGK
jgi:hypothetical protein